MRHDIARSDLRKTTVWTAVGFILGIALLYVAFRKVDFETLVSTMRGVGPGWPLAVLFSAVMFMLLKAWRWCTLLEHLRKPRFVAVLAATYSGVAINFMVSHLGEVVRAAMVSRSIGHRFSSVLASVFIERVFDFLALLVVIFFFALVGTDLPGFVIVAGAVCGVIAISSTAMFLAVLDPPRWLRAFVERVAAALPEGIVAWISGQLVLLRAGLEPIKAPRLVAETMVVSVAQWLTIIAAIWCSVVAVSGAPSAESVVVIFVLIVLGLSLPNSPMQLGTTQIAFVLGLATQNVEASVAIAASIIYMSFLIVPTMAIGACFFFFRDRQRPGIVDVPEQLPSNGLKG